MGTFGDGSEMREGLESGETSDFGTIEIRKSVEGVGRSSNGDSGRDAVRNPGRISSDGVRRGAFGRALYKGKKVEGEIAKKAFLFLTVGTCHRTKHNKSIHG